MRIAILSRNENLYSTMRLKQAGEERGHQIDVIDTLHCYMDITSNNPMIAIRVKNCRNTMLLFHVSVHPLLSTAPLLCVSLK